MKALRVLDIGARYGVHPSWKKFSGEVYYELIEADISEVKRLKKKYRNYKNIEIKNLAFGLDNEYLDLMILNNPAMSGFTKRVDVTPRYTGLIKKQQKVKKFKRIKSISLNKYLKLHKKKFDFLKLDVEGFEVAILNNGLKIFDDLIGARSEVCFTKAYKSKYVNIEGTFNSLHKIFLNNKFVLLNLDYDGRGDFYSKFISQDNKKYGQLESTDAVWVKDPKFVTKNFSEDQIVKYLCFLILNDAVDVALWVLNKTYKKFKCFKKSSTKKSMNFIKNQTCRYFYSLKFNPNQNINMHKKFYEKIFNISYPEMNKFNELKEFNPF